MKCKRKQLDNSVLNRLDSLKNELAVVRLEKVAWY